MTEISLGHFDAGKIGGRIGYVVISWKLWQMGKRDLFMKNCWRKNGLALHSAEE
jgi:prolipoprotein diacylglyceryltransferase